MTINGIRPHMPHFGKKPSTDQFEQLREMVSSFPGLGTEVADRLTVRGVDYQKGNITLPGQIRLIPGVLYGFARSMKAAKDAAARTGQPAYHVQWLELPNTPAAQAWVHRTDDDRTEGDNQLRVWKNGTVTANYGKHLLNIRRVGPSDPEAPVGEEATCKLEGEGC